MTRALARLNAQWMDKATCTSMTIEESEVFFDTKPAGKAAAALVCANCPVTAECNQAGDGQYGTWAGEFTPASKMRTGVGDYLRHLCGTEAAYKRHRRDNEQPCQACIEAHDRRRNRRSGR